MTSWRRAAIVPCPKGPPLTKKWFVVEVDVTNENVRVALNGDFVASLLPHFRPTGRVGVMAPTGNGYVVFFEEPKLRQLESNFGRRILIGSPLHPETVSIECVV